MSERYEDPHSGAGRAMNTGEFRAAPDISASTAQFRAFAEREAEPAGPWGMGAGAPGRNVTRLAVIVIGVAVVIAVIAILIATVG